MSQRKLIAQVLLCLATTLPLWPQTTLASEDLTAKLGCARILPQGKSGFYAYFDPSTGKLASAATKGSGGVKLTPDALYRFSTFHEGLSPKVLPDGSMKLDIQGRFQQGSIAVLDAKGHTRIIHIGGEIFLSEAGRCMRAAIIDRYRKGLLGERR